MLEMLWLSVWLRVILVGYSVSMVIYGVTKMIRTSSAMIGQFFDTTITESLDKKKL